MSQNTPVPDVLVTKILSQFTSQISTMLVQTVAKLGQLMESGRSIQHRLVEKAFSTGFKLGRSTKLTEEEAHASFRKAVAQSIAEIAKAQEADYARLERWLHASFVKSGIPLSKEEIRRIVDTLRHPLDRPDLGELKLNPPV